MTFSLHAVLGLPAMVDGWDRRSAKDNKPNVKYTVLYTLKRVNIYCTVNKTVEINWTCMVSEIIWTWVDNVLKRHIN